MTNNRSNFPEGKHEGGKTPPKEQRTQILVFLANWASEMFRDRSPEENLQLLETLKRTYLISDWANDEKERGDVLLLFDKLEALFEKLETWTAQDFTLIDKWILKEIA